MLYGTVIRTPAVAGLFYPEDRHTLLEMVRGFLDGPALALRAPKALIAPHAGFLYSGHVAGSAFAQLQTIRDSVTRVVLAGPSHRICFPGDALAAKIGGSFGDASPEAVAAVLEQLWGGPETLICVSSDLSHYHAYDEARRMDAQTSRAIETLDDTTLDAEHACGWLPVRGLLRAARRHGLTARALDVRNSGDTAGSRDKVVGYGAYAFY